MPQTKNLIQEKAILHIERDLSEAKFDGQERTVEVTVIHGGWSHNGFYYKEKALNDIVSFLETTASSVFLDHNPKDKAFEPRKTEDHIGESLRAWREGNDVKSVMQVFKTGPNNWVFDRMQETKTKFGPSIVGIAQGYKGTAEGRSGFIVEGMKYLHAYEIVTRPSAGGKVNAILSESDDFKTFDDIAVLEGSHIVEIEEGMLQDQIDREKKRRDSQDAFWKIESAFFSILGDIVSARNDYQYLSIKERRNMIDAVLEDFSKELKKIPFVDPKPNEKTNSNNQTSSEGDDMPKTLEQIRNEDKDLYAAVMLEAERKNLAVEQIEQLKNDSIALAKTKEALDNAESKIKTLESEKATLEGQNKKLQESVDSARAKEIASEMDTIIESCRAESKLTPEQCSEAFRAVLKSVTYESADQYRKAIKAQFDDRKALIESLNPKPNPDPVKKIEGAGPSANPNQTVTETKKFPMDSEKIARAVGAIK